MTAQMEQPTPTSAINRDSYNAIAGRWDTERRTFYGRERDYLDALVAGLPAGARVLDLGCGTGRPMAEYVLSKGHHLTGVDQAGALLNIARARYPEATWINARIETFAPASAFDAILCWDSLFHIERERHAALFQRFAALLPPGGRLMTTLGGSAHPPFTDTMYGRTFFYDSHPPEPALALLDAAGFTPVIAEFMNPPTAGRDKGRYAVVARRR